MGCGVWGVGCGVWGVGCGVFSAHSCIAHTSASSEGAPFRLETWGWSSHAPTPEADPSGAGPSHGTEAGLSRSAHAAQMEEWRKEGDSMESELGLCFEKGVRG